MSKGQDDVSAIYAEYYPKIVGYLRRQVGDAEAEDVAQEVFVKVSRSLGSFRGESSLSTWIYRIATNAARDHFRKPSTQQALRTQDVPAKDELQDRDSKAAFADTSQLCDTLLIRKDMNECIRGLVNDLPDIYRTVLVLGDMEEFTNAEIASILGLSLDAVKIRMHRGRLQLKRSMSRACHLYHDHRNELACDRKPSTIEFRKRNQGVSFSR